MIIADLFLKVKTEIKKKLDRISNFESYWNRIESIATINIPFNIIYTPWSLHPTALTCVVIEEIK